MTLGDCQIKAMLATSNPKAAKLFYGEVLGLKFVSESQFAVIFEGAGTRVHLQKIESFKPHQFTSMGWSVPDINAVVRELKRRGVTFERYQGMKQDDEGIWTTEGGKVCWFKDPDGNVLSLTQAD